MLKRAFVAAVAMVVACPAQGQAVAKVDAAPVDLARLPVTISGRVLAQADGSWMRQWPGTYFETAVIGPEAFFRIGTGEVSLTLRVDGGAPVSMVKPAPGLYRVSGLGAGGHRLRIDVASESQAGPTDFGGFFAGPGVQPTALPHRPRAIEFIGDSHTVGYGNTASTRQCSEDQVWATTDTSRGLAAQLAARYDADYEVNAISGRGVVRNYGGFPADTLPTAYPFVLFDKAETARDPAWRPQVIAIALGTNDFSTPLHAGEKWQTREALRADYEASYVRFVQKLRARYPGAYVMLWATDSGDGEIRTEVAKVADQLRRAGDTRVGFVPVSGLAFSACNAHPSVADDGKVADALAAYLDAHPEAWGGVNAAATTNESNGSGSMNKHLVAGGAAALAATAALAQTGAPTPAAPTAQSPATPMGGSLADKLINQPAAATWNVFGTGQTNQVLKDGGPQGYPALRVTVPAKGANPWDAGAVSPVVKPIAAGDAVLVAVFLRAPMLKDGETTPVSYLGLSQASAPYDMIATASVNVTNQWKLYYASGTATKAYAADAIAAGLHLATDKHVLDLGPVRVFDLGQGVDLARLPKNG